MGNSASNSKLHFLNDVVSHGKENDPRFGRVAFHHEKDEPAKLYLSKKVWTDSSEESSAVAELLELRQAVSHQNLAQLVNYEKSPQHHAMTTFTKHFFAWEYFDNDLERDIRAKQAGDYGSGITYTEPQLWYFLNAAVNADLALQRQGGLYHGNLQPATLLLDGARNAKLLDNRTLFPTATTYDRMLHDRAVRAAVSPGLMRELKQSLVSPAYNASKEDAWALGVTGLCAAAGRSLDDYYDWRGRRVRLDEIESDLQGLEGLYSPQLIAFLRSCLQEEEAQRLPLEAHEEFLASFQAAIYALQLDFAKKGPRVVYEDVVETKVFYETNVEKAEPRNDLLIGDSGFFTAEPPRVVSPPSRVINTHGDFFETPEIIDLPPVKNAYVINSQQPQNFF